MTQTTWLFLGHVGNVSFCDSTKLYLWYLNCLWHNCRSSLWYLNYCCFVVVVGGGGGGGVCVPRLIYPISDGLEPVRANPTRADCIFMYYIIGLHYCFMQKWTGQCHGCIPHPHVLSWQFRMEPMAVPYILWQTIRVIQLRRKRVKPKTNKK